MMEDAIKNCNGNNAKLIEGERLNNLDFTYEVLLAQSKEEFDTMVEQLQRKSEGICSEMNVDRI